MSEPKPEAYSPEYAATLLGVHPETIRREIARGNLKAFRVGQQLRILRSDLRGYMEARNTRPTSYRAG